MCYALPLDPLSGFLNDVVIEAAREQPLMRLLAPLIARTFYRVRVFFFYQRGAQKK